MCCYIFLAEQPCHTHTTCVNPGILTKANRQKALLCRRCGTPFELRPGRSSSWLVVPMKREHLGATFQPSFHHLPWSDLALPSDQPRNPRSYNLQFRFKRECIRWQRAKGILRQFEWSVCIGLWNWALMSANEWPSTIPLLRHFSSIIKLFGCGGRGWLMWESSWLGLQEGAEHFFVSGEGR